MAQRPDLRVGEIGNTGTPESGDQVPAPLVLSPEQLGPLSRNGFHGPIDLATRGELLVEQGNIEAVFSRNHRSSQPGRAGTDDDQWVMIFHVGSTPVPCWRSIVMPSCTRSLQARWLGWPSITIRHS